MSVCEPSAPSQITTLKGGGLWLTEFLDWHIYDEEGGNNDQSATLNCDMLEINNKYVKNYRKIKKNENTR